MAPVVANIATREITWNVESGELRCRTCATLVLSPEDTKFCEHLQVAIRECKDVTLFDASLTRQNNPDRDEFEPFYLNLPFMPSAGIWVELRLEMASIGSLPVYKVLFASGQLRNQFLCHLLPGEGISAMRNAAWMLVRSAEADARASQKVECTSRQHSFEAQLKWQAMMRNKVHATRQFASVVFTGKCLMCATRASSNSDDDLVPDPGSSPSPFAGRRR